MKVIQKGRRKYWWVGAQVSCNECKSKVELQKSDGAIGQKIIQWKCPECGQWSAHNWLGYPTQEYGGPTY